MEKSNCRWSSGECHLENADFLFKLTVVGTQTPTLTVLASHPVDGLLVSVGSDPDASPDPMQIAADEPLGQVWQLRLSQWPEPGDRIRLAVRAAGSSWYGEAGVTFLHAAAAIP